MASFRYRYGDRPLEGYTIEHGVGRGGFGEVYYAVSDSGRQVALKAVQNFEEIELRGISHCMNLKSPHLVTVFDVKFNADGTPFVIMEYVAGPSLRQLIDAHPQGLGADKAAFFTREIAKGLQYLHDSGVVHRDLKPHNVFYEDGMVKIGDYSLSKAITTSHRSGHTITVGTVHYMAPEISMGKYGKEVDIYALGVMLYEMLTGTPPFVGQSMAEVLMKHMTATPDVSHLPAPFDQVVLKAMAKDPADRYQSPSDMVAALMGDIRLQESVTSLSPETLSVVAARALRNDVNPAEVAMGETRSVVMASPADTPIDRPQWAHAAPRPRAEAGARAEAGEGARAAAARPASADRPDSSCASFPRVMGRGVRQLGLALQAGFMGTAASDPGVEDELSPEKRIRLSLFAVAAISLLTAFAVGPSRASEAFRIWMMVFAGITVGVAMVDWTRRNLVPALAEENGLMKRMIYVPMVLGGTMLSAAIIDRMTSVVMGSRPLVSDKMMLACLIPFTIFDWRQLSSPNRAQRLNPWPAIGAAAMAFPLAMLDRAHSPGLAMGLAAGVVLVTQLMHPWSRRTAEAKTLFTGTAHDQRKKKHGCGATMRPAWWSRPGSRSPGNMGEPVAAEVIGAPTGSVGGAAVSPRSRTVALLLTVIGPAFGLAGLQRLYAGRIGTGILWLLTWGLLGIGQLIDLFVVAAGELRDGQQRLITRWKSTPVEEPAAEPVNALSKVARTSSYPGSWADHLISLVGVVFLGAALVFGAGAAIKLPVAVRELMIHNDNHSGVARDLMQIDRTFGENWPELVVQLGWFAALLFGGIAMGLLILGRRHTSAAHIARAVLAVALVGGACLIIHEEFSRRLDWTAVAMSINQHQFPTDTVVQLLRGDRSMPLLLGVFAVIGSLVLLAWPRRRLGIDYPAPVAAASPEPQSIET